MDPSSRGSAGLVAQSDRSGLELVAVHELQFDPLAQAGEQRRSVAGQDGLHDELVLVDQSQIRQGQRESHAAHEQAFARPLLEPPNGFAQVAVHELRVPIDLLSVLDTTYFLAPSIFWAKAMSASSIQSGHVPVAGCRHAASIIS